MGAVFSRLIRKRPSTDKPFSGRPRSCRPCFRSADSSCLRHRDGMPSNWPSCRADSFAVRRMDGTRSCLSRAQTIGFGCRNFRAVVQYSSLSCRSTPVSTYALRRHSDFGWRSRSALSDLPFPVCLFSVGGGSPWPYVLSMAGWRETAIVKSPRVCLGDVAYLFVAGKLTTCAAALSVWSGLALL